MDLLIFWAEMVPKWKQKSFKNAIFGLLGRLGGTWGAFRAPGGEKM